ncbi:MAG: transcriptional regulator NrdR [bacterium]|nr:transcriptional regulator NrdR [candidate division WOR-3 bacterium]MDH5683348.1 transcriptional regulator NrdR [candidate division WOR-3 bacterium]
MKCPNCGKEEDRVLDTRPVLDGDAVRRRRECVACGHRYTTYEYVEHAPLIVIKRDGKREPYSRDKLISGIALACRKRPITRDQIEHMVEAIETELADQYKLEVEAKELGKMVLERLAKIDQVAYVRFASVYRAFENVEQFISEIRNIINQKRGVESKVTDSAKGG